MLSWRLLLADGDPRYADLMERTLYNVIATSPDEAGTAFFYVNPLRRSLPGVPPSLESPSVRAASSLRAPWFEVSCCPSNVARTIASVGAYLATVSADGLQLHQYMAAEITTSLPDGESVAVSVATGYPVDGRVEVTVESDAAREWTLSLRVPVWAEGRATITLDGVSSPVDGRIAAVTRQFSAGDRIVLEFPIEPRVTVPDLRIDALRESVAVELGPLVLCAESSDLPSVDSLEALTAPADSRPTRAGDDTVEVTALLRTLEDDRGWPYGEAPQDATAVEQPVTLIPYHRWAERGPSTMRVWLPTTH
jgi:DUF1680 family protein